MPRSGDGVYSLPANTAAVTGQTIASAKYNTVNNDIANDLNAARPITAGGTGATNASDALANLGGVGQSNFLGAFSIGDFYDTVRDISSESGVWLRRDGALYDSVDYPELAAALPPLPDGVIWVTGTSTASGSLQSVISNNGQFYIAEDGGADTRIYSSSDGKTFSLTATIPTFDVTSMAYGGGIYAATDGNGKYSSSTDAVTWASPGTLPGGNYANSVAYGDGRFVLVGGSGAIYTSDDMTSFTARTSGVATTLRSVRWLNNGFVVTGSNGIILSSPDGITWTPRTSGTTNNIHDVAYGQSVYLFCGSGGLILTSPNLTTYTPRSSGVTSTLNTAGISSSGYIVAGASGVVRISSNLTSWNASPLGTSSAINSLVIDPARPEHYVLVGSSGTIKEGTRTLPTQFRVPNDDPTYGWIKAEDA